MQHPHNAKYWGPPYTHAQSARPEQPDHAVVADDASFAYLCHAFLPLSTEVTQAQLACDS